MASWVLFNLVMGALMGTFHQGGVVPAQMYIAQADNVRHAVWWKTYSPPIWLLDGKIGDVETTDFMGAPLETVFKELMTSVPCSKKENSDVILIAPASATALDIYVANSTEDVARKGVVLKERARFNKHISLDDLDFAEDGVWPTLQRVFGRRGLVIWDVERRC
jgi:phosphatidylinositol glycan class Z